MTDINSLHDRAMEFVDEALAARRAGDSERERAMFTEAFHLEKQAAELVRDDLHAEPTRSVLYRSAATLALDCGKFKDAEELARIGLNGNPPDAIKEELWDILKSPLLENKVLVPVLF